MEQREIDHTTSKEKQKYCKKNNAKTKKNSTWKIKSKNENKRKEE